MSVISFYVLSVSYERDQSLRAFRDLGGRKGLGSRWRGQRGRFGAKARSARATECLEEVFSRRGGAGAGRSRLDCYGLTGCVGGRDIAEIGLRWG